MVTVYEYESEKKIPTQDELEVCCKDDAFNDKPKKWSAHNLVTNNKMQLKDNSQSFEPKATIEWIDSELSHVTQADICKATNFFEDKDHSVSSQNQSKA